MLEEKEIAPNLEKLCKDINGKWDEEQGVCSVREVPLRFYEEKQLLKDVKHIQLKDNTAWFFGKGFAGIRFLAPQGISIKDPSFIDVSDNRIAILGNFNCTIGEKIKCEGVIND
jgi:hypothetical protein